MSHRIHMYFLIIIFFIAAAPVHAEPVRVAEVMTASGAVAAVQSEEKRGLKTGSPLFREDRLVTGAGGLLQAMFPDGTVLRLGEYTEIDLRDVAYEPGECDEGVLHLEVIAGTCRFVTGQLTRHNPEGFRVDTPLGSIGIRGTEGGVHAPADNPSYAVGLGDALSAPGSAWSPGPPPEVDRLSVAHIDGLVRRPMTFTDLLGASVDIPRGKVLDVSAETGADSPRDLNPMDRQSFDGADFVTSAPVPSDYARSFTGYDASPGANLGGALSGGSAESAPDAAEAPGGGGGQQGGGTHGP